MDSEILTAALAHWGFGNARCTLIAARENRVYRAELANGPVAIRLHRVGLRNEAELKSELQWMDMLSQAGLCVPRPISAPNGSSITTINGVVVDVVSWLEGLPLSDTHPAVADFTRLGQLMAQMHNLTDHWTIPTAFTRPKWDSAGLIGEAPFWGRFWENPTLTTDQKTTLSKFRDHAANALSQDADYGLIHADMVPENILVSDQNLYAIDFDDGGFGYRLFDIATVTNRSKRISPDGSLADAFLEGYARLRPHDHTRLPLFEALRACTYLGWIVPRLSEAGATQRNARFITEAMAKVAIVLTQRSPK